MPDAYTQMANRMANFAKPFEEIEKLKLKPQDWMNTPGGQIMSALPPHNPTFVDLFNAFTTYGRTNGWTWDPGIIGAKKGPLLDGTVTAGECAIFAANLLLLAQLPKPYGLQMPKGTEPAYWAFYGKHSAGFVCDHDLTNIMSVFSGNVSLPDHLQHPTDYYLWPNHKVLVWNNYVYDPSYGTVTPKTEYLGLYQLKRGNGPEDRVTVTFSDRKYVVSSGPSFAIEYLWRCIPKTEHPGRPFQGPYTINEVDH